MTHSPRLLLHAIFLLQKCQHFLNKLAVTTKLIHNLDLCWVSKKLMLLYLYKFTLVMVVLDRASKEKQMQSSVILLIFKYINRIYIIHQIKIKETSKKSDQWTIESAYSKITQNLVLYHIYRTQRHLRTCFYTDISNSSNNNTAPLY